MLWSLLWSYGCICIYVYIYIYIYIYIHIYKLGKHQLPIKGLRLATTCHTATHVFVSNFLKQRLGYNHPCYNRLYAVLRDTQWWRTFLETLIFRMTCCRCRRRRRRCCCGRCCWCCRCRGWLCLLTLILDQETG